ncbi:MAG: hypothetical protein QOD43_2105, partial [Gaiellaceae bacterium]|nr:hypothetical protein [Gaiellaceae bacterium]
MRCPRNPISAGSSVCAAAIGNKTAIDAATAAPDRTLTPTVNMPHKAMHTVRPAKSTARPAVAPAVDWPKWIRLRRRLKNAPGFCGHYVYYRFPFTFGQVVL